MPWFWEHHRDEAREQGWQLCRQRLWAVVQTHARTTPAHAWLMQVLAQADERASRASAWPDAFARALVAALTDLLQRLQTAEQERTLLQSEVTYLRRQVDAYWNHPLQQQVREVEKERDAWREEAERLRQRLAQVEATLARERAWWEQERARLEQTIADLNRIVAEQQEALNVLMEGE